MKKRRKTWYSNIFVPEDLRPHFGGKQIIEKTLSTSDERIAQAKAFKLKGDYDLKFQTLRRMPSEENANLRQIYQDNVELVLSGDYGIEGPDIHSLEDSLSVALEIEEEKAIKEAKARNHYDEELPPDLATKLRGQSDGIQLKLRKETRFEEEYDPLFEDVAKLA